MEEGQINISLPTTSEGRHNVEITVVDAKSLTHFIRVKIPIAEWALATVGSIWGCECEFELNATKVGKERQVKHENVRIPNHSFDDRKWVAKEAVEKHEVDGWVGRVENALNHNKRVFGDEHSSTYSVTFIRFV